MAASKSERAVCRFFWGSGWWTEHKNARIATAKKYLDSLECEMHLKQLEDHIASNRVTVLATMQALYDSHVPAPSRACGKKQRNAKKSKTLLESERTKSLEAELKSTKEELQNYKDANALRLRQHQEERQQLRSVISELQKYKNAVVLRLRHDERPFSTLEKIDKDQAELRFHLATSRAKGLKPDFGDTSRNTFSFHAHLMNCIEKGKLAELVGVASPCDLYIEEEICQHQLKLDCMINDMRRIQVAAQQFGEHSAIKRQTNEWHLLHAKKGEDRVTEYHRQFQLTWAIGASKMAKRGWALRKKARKE